MQSVVAHNTWFNCNRHASLLTWSLPLKWLPTYQEDSSWLWTHPAWYPGSLASILVLVAMISMVAYHWVAHLWTLHHLMCPQMLSSIGSPPSSSSSHFSSSQAYSKLWICFSGPDGVLTWLQCSPCQLVAPALGSPAPSLPAVHVKGDLHGGWSVPAPACIGMPHNIPLVEPKDPLNPRAYACLRFYLMPTQKLKNGTSCLPLSNALSWVWFFCQ